MKNNTMREKIQQVLAATPYMAAAMPSAGDNNPNNLAMLVDTILVHGNTISCIVKPAMDSAEAMEAIEACVKKAAPFMQVKVLKPQSLPPSSNASEMPATPNTTTDATMQDNTRPLNPSAGIDGIKRIIAVASGKGGVGKSTVAVNLALSLTHKGLKVGLLDADIYGPSIPIMLASQARPDSPDGKTIIPVQAYGLSTLSIGYMLAGQEAVIWRGPMLHSALQQMLMNVLWGSLDVLMIDMPPGTGDVALTLAQKARLDGAIVVTTPQNVALADARKAMSMFTKVKVPIIGLIENMAFHQCPQCGHQQHLFGQGGGDRQARASQVPLLGQLPLHTSAAMDADQGTPLVGAGGALDAEFAAIRDRLIQHWS